MVVVLLVAFGAVSLWVMMSNSTSIEGRVELVRAEGTTKLEVFGCLVDRVTDKLTATLRDAEPADGFRLEQRAVILQDTSTRGESTTPRPVEGLVVSYRQQDNSLVPLTCTEQRNTLTIRTGRRAGSKAGREDRWDGEYQATCAMDGGTVNIELEMQNCD